jgi:hypothetical protein
MFAIVGQQIVAATLAGVGMRATQRAMAHVAVQIGRVHAFAGSKFSLGADVFAAQWRVVQHTAIAQGDATVHYQPFTAGNHVSWSCIRH